MKFSLWLENRTSKKIMYHAAPISKRASILKHGLNFRIHFEDTSKPKNTRDVNYAPRGNYMSERMNDAVMYTQGRGTDRYDIWQVNVEGFHLFRDQAWFKGWYCRKSIPPENLKLIVKG